MENKFFQLDCNFDKKSVKKINSQFATVKIKIAYPGLNRNGSIISKDLLNKMSKESLQNIPIVGEWSEEKQNFLGHGGKLEISSQGIRYIDTTRPYGVIPSDSEISWEKVKSKKGEEKEYLCCTGIIWYGRYSETEKILNDGSNQSMELIINKGSYDADDNFIIEDAEFSALCILGKDPYHAKNDPASSEVEPCFEDSDISTYNMQLNKFKEEFSLLMQEIAKYNLGENPSLYKSNTTNKKEDKEIMKDKIVDALSSLTFKNQLNKDINKYFIVNISENMIDVIDREDGFNVYALVYSTSEDGELNIDFDTKVPRSISMTDKIDEDFCMKTEFDYICKYKMELAVAAHQSHVINELNDKLEKLSEDYGRLSAEHEENIKILAIYDQEKQDLANSIHAKEIDAVVKDYESKIGQSSEFLLYKANIDYSKTIEQVNTDMLILVGKYNLKNKSTYSFGIQTEPVIEDAPAKGGDSRYGNLFDKIKKVN